MYLHSHSLLLRIFIPKNTENLEKIPIKNFSEPDGRLPRNGYSSVFVNRYKKLVMSCGLCLIVTAITDDVKDFA